DAALGERGGEPARAGVELGVVAPEPAVNDGGVIRENRGGPLDKSQWRQRLEVRRIAVEGGLVRGWRHGFLVVEASLAGCRAKDQLPPGRQGAAGQVQGTAC